MQSDPLPAIFAHGNKWVRADFHLHTRKDKEFDYVGEENAFAGAFLDRLAEEEVRVGLVTNHNKFDAEEFRTLRKAARKRELFLLPGVELSVNDGAKGIHALVAFDPERWLEPQKDWINDFLNAAFHDTGVADRENENARCGWNLKHLLQELHDSREKHGRDSFVILAHVEQSCGFFNDLEGGRITEFGQQALFWENVLGFQKVRTWDKRAVWRQWLGRDLPACVEGSDPKKLESVGVAHVASGEPQRTYLHIGDFTFDAIKLALRNHSHRVASSPLESSHPKVQTLTVEGSGPNGVKAVWHLNSGLNNLIGIRGSGKSTLLEMLRYGLGVELRGPWTTEPPDEIYKNGLIKSHLGSGGQVRLQLRAQNGKEYEVRRIFGEPPQVYLGSEIKANLRPNGGLLRALYFGQKDLGELGKEDRNTDFIEKFYGEELREVRAKRANDVDAVRELVQRLQKQATTLERRQEFLATKAKIEESLKVFEEHKVVEKLQRQVAFNTDRAMLDDMATWLGELIAEMEELHSERVGRLADFLAVESKENANEIAAAKEALKPASSLLAEIKTRKDGLLAAKARIEELRAMVSEKWNTLAEEFAAIRRQIEGTDLNADTYVDLQRRQRTTKLSLEELDRQEAKKQQTQAALNTALETLRNCWHEEFRTIEEKVSTLNGRNLPIELDLHYRGNKKAFEEYLKEVAKGSGITAVTFERLAAEFVDPIDIYQEMQSGGDRWKKSVSMPASQQKLEDRFKFQLADFLTYRVPDRLELRLRGQPLSRHSLGQRTSALVLFLLEKGDYDVLLIDQPEDDLDNQTIYQDVIRRLRVLKTRHQFVFATHNANIPVLGEAEMVAACRYGENNLELIEGSTDHPPIQQSIISVMEGGDEAFRLRNQIYEQWKH